MFDGDSNEVYDFAKVPEGWFEIAVPKGQDGRLWKFEKCRALIKPMTIPPYGARTAEELLLPKEVIQADSF